jgi:putative addiction module component (TIGR02574 family)
MSHRPFDYRRLPIPERLKLVEEIWDSIALEANVRPDVLPLTETQRAELMRRLDDADAHPEDTIPWHNVRPQLFKRGG